MMFITYLIIGCIFTVGYLMPSVDCIKEIYGDPLDLLTVLGLVLGVVICVLIWPVLLVSYIVNTI